ncbi:hypothetical protein L6452_05299 [Arctium lappa]|uniref:Uncharacterized protein n=1 Tax=Arctium lappa TaxID=4217 RepID=A0ACB9EG73_ARCLA|nr:hypothetical protein L6452_05299 [Arctium lappa]
MPLMKGFFDSFSAAVNFQFVLFGLENKHISVWVHFVRKQDSCLTFSWTIRLDLIGQKCIFFCSTPKID